MAATIKQVNAPSDSQLLRAYAESHDESAFAELVRRHIDLVYSAAVRMVCDSHLAEDVTQGVFVALSKNAGQLADRPVLSGWLHRTAQNIAAQTVRTDVRRRAREQEAGVMNELLSPGSDLSRRSGTEADAWEQILPHLDAALGELREPDRDSVLLRYFEKKSAQEMAELLGISAETAQKRVNRAVERLREFFSKRNVTIGASGLAVLISANAVQAAPVGLAATISTAVVLAGTTVSTSTIIAATKAIAMTTLQKTVVTAALAATIGTGIYEAHQAAQLRDQNQALQQRQAPLAEQIRQLQRERDDATNRLAGLLAESVQLKSSAAQNEREIPKLRSEITQLQEMQSKATNDPFTQSVMALVKRAAELNNWLQQMPDKQIPELQWLDANDWLKAAQKANLDTDNGVRQALSQLRDLAKHDMGTFIGNALDKYISQNNGQLPDDISKLGPYFNPPMDPAILQRYQMMPAGGNSQWAIEEIAPSVDKKYDSHLYIGSRGHVGTFSLNNPDDPDPSWSKK